MASQNTNKPESRAPVVVQSAKPKNWALLLLRVLAFCATATATIVMALNKETNTFVVATMGTTSIKATLTAKFQHTPAFVFFVIGTALVSLHNLLMILVSILGGKLHLRHGMVAILDMLNATLISAAVNAAVFMAQLGKYGNSHARWSKICDKFETFCSHGAIAILASYIGLGLMLLISVMSILQLIRPKSNYQVSNP
ncbi:CASP-like protein 1B1 isoform X1 [Mangifera indica]|uniref:CASP-like protein 1B1 isoform X1 n=1 Tax=Mangifera indica TaxID=29780 RepID=UPI001CF9B4BF|nr:CASP-like protein 1B1 isoform X1 [Mangifera indica]XP_044509572.1 CASP-like protein 1B1 isoform X1 [Mangifera indica]